LVARKNDNNMRLLIVDDHPMTCAGLKSLLQAYFPDASIDAHHDTSALDRGLDRWDYVFLDMHLPGIHFQDLLESIQDGLRRVILISANPEPEIVEQAKARGAAGLLVKNADVQQIVEGFRRIRTGERVFVGLDGPAMANPARPAGLTERQQEVFDALIVGLSNKQIARKLNISEYTVKEHVAAILERFGVRNRMALLLKMRHPVV
jgi:two-component system nitrate/nitrite response regulator NarL